MPVSDAALTMWDRPPRWRADHAEVQPGKPADGRLDPAGARRSAASAILRQRIPFPPLPLPARIARRVEHARSPSTRSSARASPSRSRCPTVRPATSTASSTGSARANRFPSAMGSAFFTRYQAEIVPQLWLLTRKAQSRIFQQIAVPDILKQVLTGLSVAYQLQGTYKPRDYCVQYRETDFNFASRLMEEEGIYYFFTHADGSHQMVVADTPRATPTCPARRPPSTKWSRGDCARKTGSRPGRRARRSAPASTRSGTTASSCPARTWRPSSRPSTRCRRAPSTTSSRSPATTSWSSTTSPAATPSGSTASPRAAATGPATSRTSSRTTSARPPSGCSRRRRPRLSITGQSTCRQFTAGHKFTLDRHFNADGAYVLTEVGHSASMGDTYTTGSDTSPNLREHVRVHPRRPAVQAGADDAPADRRGDPDGGRGRQPRRRDLHRQVRPREGPVPLGPPGQEGRRQLLLGPGGDRSGPASSGA